MGWSSSDNPQAFFIAYFLVISTKRSLEKLPDTLKKFWDYALNISIKDFTFKYAEQKNEFLQNVNQIYQNLFLPTHVVDEKIVKWCLIAAENRVNAIVSNQHRGAYERAAILTVACTETLKLIDRIEAVQFFNKVKNKFPRHKTFQSELQKIDAASTLNLQNPVKISPRCRSSES